MFHNNGHREVLSKESSLFDPLGFVVPFSIRRKLIMKRISQGQQWDKPIEESLQESFNTWISELSQNNPIAVGRWHKMNSDDKKATCFWRCFGGRFRCSCIRCECWRRLQACQLCHGQRQGCTDEASYETEA